MSEAIARGETIKQMAGFGVDVFKAKVLPHGRTISSRTREHIFYPVSRMLANPEDYEFLEEGGKGIFPPINKGKTKLATYLDEINMIYKDNQKNELYVDQDMNLYEWDGGDNITKIYYDGRFTNVDEQGVLGSFKAREKMDLIKADKRSKRMLRALQRDAQRTWNNKRVSEDNVFWLNSKDKVDQVVKGEKDISLDKYGNVVDAVEYQNWLHNLGTKRFTKYSIQDLEVQEKAIRALGNKEIRGIVSKAITKVINGGDLTLDDVYTDMIKASGLKTGKSGPLNLEGGLLDFVTPEAMQDTGDKTRARSEMLAFNGPSMLKLGMDRESNLVFDAVLGQAAKYAEKLPGKAGWVAKGVNLAADAIAGTTGHAVGAGFKVMSGIITVGSIGLTIIAFVAKKTWNCIMSNKNKITPKNKEKAVEYISKEAKKDLLDSVKEVNTVIKEEIKTEREMRRNEEIENKQESDLRLAEKSAQVAMLDRIEETLEEDQKEKNMQYELLDSGRIKVYYDNTSAILYRYVSREEVDDWKREGRKNGRLWLYNQAKSIDRWNSKRGCKKKGPNPAMVAFFELKFGEQLPTIDTPKTQNLVIDAEDFDVNKNLMNKKRSRNNEDLDIKEDKKFRDSLIANMEEIEVGNLFQLKRKPASPGKILEGYVMGVGNAKLVDNNYRTGTAKIIETDGSAKFGQKVPLALPAPEVPLALPAAEVPLALPAAEVPLALPAAQVPLALPAPPISSRPALPAPRVQLLEDDEFPQVEQPTYSPLKVSRKKLDPVTSVPDFDFDDHLELSTYDDTGRVKKAKARKRPRNGSEELKLDDFVNVELPEEPEIFRNEITAFATDQGLFFINYFR